MSNLREKRPFGGKWWIVGSFGWAEANYGHETRRVFYGLFAFRRAERWVCKQARMERGPRDT